jgi:hypothetical protein
VALERMVLCINPLPRLERMVDIICPTRSFAGSTGVACSEEDSKRDDDDERHRTIPDTDGRAWAGRLRFEGPLRATTPVGGCDASVVPTVTVVHSLATSSNIDVYAADDIDAC